MFHEGNAGPYRLLVTIRPPQVVPGVAEVEVRGASAGIREIQVAPSPLTGPAAKLTPAPDRLARSKDDPQFFSGAIWLMACCNWQVHVYAAGAEGKGELTIPVASVASRTLAMHKAMAAGLLFFLIFLGAGAVSIAGAYAREGRLEPGSTAGEQDRRRGRRAMGFTAVLIAAAGYGGKNWWDAEDSAFRRFLYKPLVMDARYDGEAGKLHLTLKPAGWLQKTDDLLPDHGHLMHLYVFPEPGLDRVWHLHPEMTGPGVFELRLPPIPEGTYRLFGDIVHESGFPETVAASVRLPDVEGAPLGGDDAAGEGTAARGEAGAPAWFALSDGARMIWDRPPAPLRAGKPEVFRFRVVNASGEAAPGAELYMGMPGHAAFVRDDFSVFAHVHPSGTVPMASLALVDPHAAHGAGAPPAEVSFPYAFPKAGNYRIFVQVKRKGRILTGIFEAQAEGAAGF